VVLLNTTEADPAGRGSRTRICLKPGEHAVRGGTPSRPQDRKPEPVHGHARNLCRKRPEGQHPAKRWRWDGSYQVSGCRMGPMKSPSIGGEPTMASEVQASGWWRR